VKYAQCTETTCFGRPSVCWRTDARTERSRPCRYTIAASLPRRQELR